MNSKRAVVHLLSGLAVLPVILLLVAARPEEKPLNNVEKDHPGQLIPSLEGSDLFHSYCASCHGADAKGQGPAAAAFNRQAARSDHNFEEEWRNFSHESD